jgi:hypothetical protein
MTPSQRKIPDAAIDLLQSTLGNMPSSKADEIVEAVVTILEAL